MCADIAYLKHPLLAERALHGQIPLLGIRHDKVPRHLKTENVECADARAARSVHVGGCLPRVAAREVLEERQTADKSWVNRARVGQAVRIWVRAIAQRTLRRRRSQ